MTRPESVSHKRHCMVVHAHYPGGETRVQRQAEALVRHGYEVDVLCLRGGTETATEFCSGVRVIRLPVCHGVHSWVGDKLLEYLRFFVLAMFRLMWLHVRRPYRTVQVHNLPDFLVFAAWFPKLFGARVFLDIHDLMPEFYQGRYGGSHTSLSARLLYLQEKLSCRFADHVITVSDIWRQTLIGRGVPTDKCSVVMNVADQSIFGPSEAPKPEPSDGDGLNLIYHGIVPYRYGLDLVLRAIAEVCQQIPNIHLTIHTAGGEYYPTLVALAKELDLLDKHVRFSTKVVPIADLPDLIRSADIGLAPYRKDVFTDGIVPTKLMEYAALGMPAIAARTTAIESYFKDTMVEFFTPGDVDDLAHCILRLHSDRNRLARLAQGSDKFNQRYNWSKLASEYVALIEELGSQ
jgi:glycosyltransferase involved in cell wall biosynthesis